jgi:CheY-like chemotaxis protein/HPt (histidine-containing phosphotransfer) domain-containing protein
VSNAIKFTESGSVTLEVKAVETLDGRQTLRFTVQDSGIGMSAETQQRIFEPFQQGESNTSRRFGGTGLGLSISRQLVELMGGRIEVASAPGVGTRVTVTLAASEASAARGENSQSESPPAALRAPAGVKLLVVDDHPVNLAMLQRQLKVLGLEADTATNGAEALAKWRRERHDLVITDVQMPGMDGYAVARAIRKEQGNPGPTVVAFTANTHREALDQCTAAGMDDYLTKPTELATLRDKLARWLAAEAGVRRAPADNAIDRRHIEELVGGPAGLATVLETVARSARRDIEGLQSAMDAKDGDAIRAAAHRIKGTALNLGANRLAAAAARVENAAEVVDPDGVRAMIDELKMVLAAAA